MRAVPSTIATRLYRAAGPIADRGLDETKIEELAEVTGVPKATLYYYFTGKEEILAFLLTEMLGLMSDSVAIASENPGTARERLGRVIEAQLRVMSEHADVYRALIGELGRAGRIPEIVAALNQAFYTPLQRLLAEGTGDGSLRRVEDPQSASVAIFGAVTMTGLSRLVAEGEIQAEAVARELITLVVDGLRPTDRRSR